MAVKYFFLQQYLQELPYFLLRRNYCYFLLRKRKQLPSCNFWFLPHNG